MEVSRHWRTQAARYRLVAGFCEMCNLTTFPAREQCPRCRRSLMRRRSLKGNGEVYSYSTVFQPPADFLESSPCTAALIRLEEGPMVAGLLTDVESGDVQIGMKVEVVLRRLRDESARGLVLYGYKFRPRVESTSHDSAR